MVSFSQAARGIARGASGPRCCGSCSRLWHHICHPLLHRCKGDRVGMSSRAFPHAICRTARRVASLLLAVAVALGLLGASTLSAQATTKTYPVVVGPDGLRVRPDPSTQNA